MSVRGLSAWMCARVTLGYGLLLLAALPGLTTGRPGNCSHPQVHEHGGFRCEPSPCRPGFPHKTNIHYFCEPGYHLPVQMARRSRCSHSRWTSPVPTCQPMKGAHVKHEDRTATLPSVATTAVGVSIFLLTTTACMVIKSRLYPCDSHSRRSSDTLGLMVGGFPVSLPSYEEAVYGSWGQRLPPRTGPTQLLLAQETPGHDPPSDHNQSASRLPHPSSQCPAQAPPPYEEVQLRPREGQSDSIDGRASNVISDDKDI